MRRSEASAGFGKGIAVAPVVFQQVDAVDA
jgi:hypothetical protein